MNGELLNLALIVWCAAAVAMFVTWLVQVKTKDASYVDVIWALGIGCATLYTFIFFTDYSLRKIIIFLCPLFWSLRLSYHLTRRLLYLNQEDSRYKTMRESMADKANLGFLIFFQVQAIFVIMFSLPIMCALLTESKDFNFIDLLGLVIFITAFTGESLADRQLLSHRKQYGAKVTCQSGLWYYSRHPNYFFEWIHWFSYACFCFYSSYFLFTLMMPFVMLFFIIKITGIPHVERESLKKKPDYKEYMANTPMIIPNIFK